MKNKIGLLTLLIASVIAFAGMASALNVQLEEVKLDGDEVSQSGVNVYDFDKDNEVEVKVRLTANEDIDDAQIEARIRGYDHDDLMEDITDAFDMSTGVTYTKKLTIPLRLRMDSSRYLLRITVVDRNGAESTWNFELDISGNRHQIAIKDIILSPENEVKAGRALLTSVRLQNYGEKDEDGIRVKVSIPALGVSATDYIDELEKEGDDDDQTTSEELYMRIPDNAETGEYTLRVEVTYDDGDETEVEEMLVRVIGYCDQAGVTCDGKSDSDDDKEKTVITIASGAQVAEQGGAEASYPITITNEGSASKTYIVSADGADWAGFRVSPSNVMVVGAGESKAVNVYVSASESAPVGEQTFVVSVKSGEKTLKEIPLKVSVSEAEGSTFDKLRRGLEVALVVIVVLLVILGLIIGFNKLRGEDEEDKEGETYY